MKIKLFLLIFGFVGLSYGQITVDKDTSKESKINPVVANFEINQKVWVTIPYHLQKLLGTTCVIGVVKDYKLASYLIDNTLYFKYWVDCKGLNMDAWYDEECLTAYKKHESRR
jgi:hypothetical protein